MSHHTSYIAIEVEYLSTSDIQDTIKELLWSYRQLYMPGAESDDVSAEDYERYARESAQAWASLEAAFGDHRQFSERWLQDMSDGAAERIEQQDRKSVV